MIRRDEKVLRWVYSPGAGAIGGRENLEGSVWAHEYYILIFINKLEEHEELKKGAQ